MSTDPHRRQWQQCQRIVDSLDLPDPFDVTEFIDSLAQTRGRPIELIPVSSRLDVPCGVLVTTDRADYILYATDTTPLHQQHILLHEAAHVICGHYKTAPAASAATRLLLPGLSPALVKRVLGRTAYTEPQEQEAELVASLILTRVAHLARTVTAEAEAPRLHTLFGRPRDRERPRDRGRADG